MAQILSIVNPKGGSGKTSAALNLSCAIAAAGRRVLLIDFDPMGSATAGLGQSRAPEGRSLAAAMILGGDPALSCCRPEHCGIDLLPSGDELTAAAVELHRLPRQEALGALRRTLSEIRSFYDLIVVDTPPSMDMLTGCALCAADSVLVPMPCEYLALHALNYLTAKIAELKSAGLMLGSITGIVRTMYEEGVPLTTAVADMFKPYERLLFKTGIPYAPAISEAPAFALPVILYEPDSTATASYLSLTAELTARMGIKTV